MNIIGKNKWKLFGAVTALLIVLAAGNCWLQTRPVDRMYTPEEKMCGIQWLEDETEPMAQVWISFDGEKNMRGEFSGDILIGSGERILYRWDDCQVLHGYGCDYYICPGDLFQNWESLWPPDHFDMMGECYAVMLTDANWGEISILFPKRSATGENRFDSSLPRITVGATTTQEARERTRRSIRKAEGRSVYDEFFEERVQGK